MSLSHARRSLVSLAAVLALFACGGNASVPPEGAPPPPESTVVVGDDPCQTDADCFPAECCHASMCVSGDNTPMCENIACTMECRPGTIDCGGGCLCVEGRCAARLMHRF